MFFSFGYSVTLVWFENERTLKSYDSTRPIVFNTPVYNVFIKGDRKLLHDSFISVHYYLVVDTVCKMCLCSFVQLF